MIMGNQWQVVFAIKGTGLFNNQRSIRVNKTIFRLTLQLPSSLAVKTSCLIKWQMLFMFKIEKDRFSDSPKNHLFSISTQNNSDNILLIFCSALEFLFIIIRVQTKWTLEENRKHIVCSLAIAFRQSIQRKWQET